MKTIVAAVLPVFAAAILAAGPAVAAAPRRVTCQQIQSALASGKKPSEVAKELKVSERHVHKCKQSSVSSASGTTSKSKTH